jgi:hypothetical protein
LLFGLLLAYAHSRECAAEGLGQSELEFSDLKINQQNRGHHIIDVAGKPSRMDRYGERASVMIGKKHGTHH